MKILKRKTHSEHNRSRKYSVWTSMGVLLIVLLVIGHSAAHAISLQDMRDSLEAELEGNVNGYAFVIKGDGTFASGAGGTAIRAVDATSGYDVPFHTHTPSFIASVTKPITAIAILQLLEANNLPMTAKIAPWLPDDWVRGPNINLLTFRNLLEHTTGFKQIANGLSESEKANWGNDWDGLKWIVANGALKTASAAYTNANFALARVLLPALWNGIRSPLDAWHYDGDYHGILYTAYVNEFIFLPSGLEGASCSAIEPGYQHHIHAFAYDVNGPLQSGHLSQTSAHNCGGHAGLRMSADDLAHVFYNLHSGGLLSPVYQFAMYQFKLGWSALSNTTSKGRKGKWWHGGDWYTGNNREYHACVMTYPNNLVASLVVNSAIQGSRACTILKNAYNRND